MKLMLCTKHDLVGSMMLNTLLPRLAPHHEITVLLANRRRPELDAIAELAWMKCFEQELGDRVLFALLDRMEVIDGAARLSFTHLARRHGVALHVEGHVGAQTLTDRVRACAPDLIVSFQFGFIFREEALAVPGLGAINLHSGALPERGGVNPTFWCMKDGDAQMACTVHRIDSGVDTGGIIDLRRLDIDYSRSFFANWMRNYRQGADMLYDAIGLLAAGQALTGRPQHGATCYVPTPTAADVQAFLTAGRRLIDPQDLLHELSQYLPASAGPETMREHA